MKTNWTQALHPLFQKYGKQKHPLDYQNRYQLIVLVILSAQTTDDRINELAPKFFTAYPTLNSLSKAAPEDLHQYIGSAILHKPWAKTKIFRERWIS